MVTTPKPHKRGYTTTPHQTVPEHLAHRLRELRDLRVGANHVFTAALIVVRDADWGVPAIAVAVEMDATTTARRICRGRHHAHVQEALATLDLDVPKPDVPADQHPYNAPKQVPAHIAAHLRQLRVHTRHHRFGMPVDHPSRVAADHLHGDVVALAKDYSLTQIAIAADVTMPAVLNWIRRYERLAAAGAVPHAA